MTLEKTLIKKIEENLEKEKKSLEEMLKSFAKKKKDNPDDWETKFPDFKAGGVLDEEADEVEEYASLLPVEQALEVKLQNVRRALEKIKDGKYGECEVCGKIIEKERLEIIPEAKTCGKHKNQTNSN